MGNNWITQCWLVCTSISVCSQSLNFSVAPWLKISNALHGLSRFWLWLVMDCLVLWFAQRWFWYHTIPLASLYESFCVLVMLFLSLLLVGLSNRSNGFERWSGLGLTLAVISILLFVEYALPLAMQQSAEPPQSLRAPWLTVHVSMMIISYAFLAGGSLMVIGGVYAVSTSLQTKWKKYVRF